MVVAEAPVRPAAVEHPEAVGRLGGRAADHVRLVALMWPAIALAVFGRHAWALPFFLGRLLLDVRFGHS